jgi:hypothetical protein
MTGPIANRPVAEGDPTAPGAGCKRRVVVNLLRRPKPLIPIQSLRNIMVLREVGQLIEARVDQIASAVNGVNIPDRAVPDPLAEVADRIIGMPLVAQLRHHLVFLRRRH